MGKVGNLLQAPLSQHLQVFTNSRSSLNSGIGSGRSPGGGHGNSLQYFCLENPMDRGGLQSIGLQRVEHYWSDIAHTHPWRLHYMGIVDQIIDNWRLICPPALLGLPCWLSGKVSACNAGDPGPVPGSGRSLGEGNGNPLQYSCLVNSTDRGAWWATVHGAAKSQTRLSD